MFKTVASRCQSRVDTKWEGLDVRRLLGFSRTVCPAKRVVRSKVAAGLGRHGAEMLGDATGPKMSLVVSNCNSGCDPRSRRLPKRKNAYEIKQPRYLDEANDDLKGVGYLDAKILRSVQWKAFICIPFSLENAGIQLLKFEVHTFDLLWWLFFFCFF